MSIFHFPYTLTWDFTAHAHKTGSLLPIFTANELIQSLQVLVVCAKFGEDRRRIADAIVVHTHTHTHTQTHRRRNPLAPSILLSTTFCYSSNVVDNYIMFLHRTRYTFYAERGYLPHCSTLRSLSNSAVVFPGALPLDPAGGCAPRPPLSRASRSV